MNTRRQLLWIAILLARTLRSANASFTLEQSKNKESLGRRFRGAAEIDQLAAPDGLPIHKTAAIYGFQGPVNPAALPMRPVGEWNQFEIRVQGQSYRVLLNGVEVTVFNFVSCGYRKSHPGWRRCRDGLSSSSR